MAKVFVLTINSVCDSLSDTENVKVYSSKKKAQEEMRKKYNAEKNDWLSTFGEDDIECNCSMMCASIQRKYEYDSDHIDYLITECEIE